MVRSSPGRKSTDGKGTKYEYSCNEKAGPNGGWDCFPFLRRVGFCFSRTAEVGCHAECNSMFLWRKRVFCFESKRGTMEQMMLFEFKAKQTIFYSG